MPFQTLPPDLVRYLVEGEVDELTSRQEERLNKIRRMACPRCGASLHPLVDAKNPFVPNDPLPKMLGTCECGFEMDVETGVIIDRGSATKVRDPFPLVGSDE